MLLSIVIPVFNEEQTLRLLVEHLKAALGEMVWELILVNDGSTDRSLGIMHGCALVDGRIKVVSFSRNFGHQAAITAGLDFARGDAVVVMDADLQDPPELLPRMVELFEQGYDIVSPQRLFRKGESHFKRWSAKMFYRLMSRLSGGHMAQDVGDFRLFSRRAVTVIGSLREQHRFMRGLAGWLGLPEAILPFERQARAGGETKYSLWKMLRFSWTAVSSFSALPLRLSLAAGALLSLLGFAYLMYVVYVAIWTNRTVPGWASVVVLQCIFSGMILLALGTIGDYVARSYEENKRRPLYIVESLRNLAPPAEGIARVSILAASTRPTIGPVQTAREEPAADNSAADLAKPAPLLSRPRGV